jgi:hypothetical protein
MAEKITLVKKINRKVVLPVREGLRRARLFPYYFLRTHSVTTNLLNREGGALYRTARQTHSPAHDRIVAELEQNGIASTRLDELVNNQGQLQNLQHYTDGLLARAREGRKKKFLEYGWREDVQPVEFDNPLLMLTLEPTMLAIAADYLATAPKLKFFSCNKTIPVSAGAEAVGSQRWHRDPGSGRILKLFLYLSDVDESAGPFTYVAGSHHGGRFGNLFKSHVFGRYGAYPPPGGVETSVPNEAVKIGTGVAGTIFFCDTLGLHRGGYATDRERIMYTALFEPPSAFGRSTLILPDPTLVQNNLADPLARFALTR